MIFGQYCPKRQHNPDTWVDDVTESDTTRQSRRKCAGPDERHATILQFIVAEVVCRPTERIDPSNCYNIVVVVVVVVDNAII